MKKSTHGGALAQLAQFIEAHGFEPTVNADSVVFFIPFAHCDKGEFHIVSTLSEARLALGY